MTLELFSSLPEPQPDPIFAIAQQAHIAGDAAINASMGVCLDERGQPLVLSVTQSAETMRVQRLSATDYSYPPVLGSQAFRAAAQHLLLEGVSQPVASCATAGGQGALHMNLHLLQRLLPQAAVVLPTPAWSNHPALCRGAGLCVQEVSYLCSSQPDTQGIIDAIARAPGNAAVLLQTGGHNPTGLDFSEEQWRELADACAKHGVLALLDCAYQGLVDEPSKDALPVRLFIERGVATLVAWSASKNHSIYAYRTGLAAAVVQSEGTKSLVEGHFSDISSALDSAAPMPGQTIVAIVQRRFHEKWQSELRRVRSLIEQKRTLLTSLLSQELLASPLRGRGFFTRLRLTPPQLQKLRSEHKTFLLDDGRMNIASIPMQRIEEFAANVRAVVAS